MGFMAWRPYVPVAVRHRNAQKKLARLKKRGQPAAPVIIAGRNIATSFWGKSWCENLESYSDYANRLPRGRTYVRNGSVVDLQIAKGEVAAFVCGSELYKVAIAITPVAPHHWKAICRDCAGSIDSLVELLGGRLAKGVMERVCRKGGGLFPAPGAIKLSCSCPDWADMCKHVAAALYGVGARLDEKPELLFVLRGVDEKDLLAAAAKHVPLAKKTPGAAKLLDESDVADVFGIEMAASADAPRLNGKSPAPSKKSRPAKPGGKDKVRTTNYIKTATRVARTSPKSENRAS
ncbi:MAG TPA: SWIM zinc finger family protein [Rhizomicrobium sp.]|jgi:uncharacterized Zn finger protein|nr:SWIM zinc finger family protein [Rhizomicrobium sp.]